MRIRMKVLGILFLILLMGSSSYVRAEEVGTFQLFKANNDGKELLYRINTKTGEVWSYSEYVILSSEGMNLSDNEKNGLQKLISDAKSKGMNVYTLPHWNKTAEEMDKGFSVH